jgi:hypothetical protein
METIDKDLQLALNNLKDDNIAVEVESEKGDSNITIRSRHWKTRIGVNDLGVWLIEQIANDGFEK